MTLPEFKAAVASTRMSLDGRSTFGALLVLVDGKDLNAASAEADCSRQAIDAAVRRVAEASKRCRHCGAKLKARGA